MIKARRTHSGKHAPTLNRRVSETVLAVCKALKKQGGGGRCDLRGKCESMLRTSIACISSTEKRPCFFHYLQQTHLLRILPLKRSCQSRSQLSLTLLPVLVPRTIKKTTTKTQTGHPSTKVLHFTLRSAFKRHKCKVGIMGISCW